MVFSPLVTELIEALRCLPGVGPKSAQRMAFYLLEHGRDNAHLLSRTLTEAMEKIGHCEVCRTFCETSICAFCESPKRDPNRLCVVETPADIVALEQTGAFRGRYFVLLGHLSPLDGIGPEDIGLEQLKQRASQQPIQEIILATNPTVEGEATAHYIAEMVKPFNIKITRIAHGVPVGGELEYIDGNTLSRAFQGRIEMESA